MNYYEVLYILNPNFGKEKIAGVMSEVSDFIEKKKHGIVNHDFWGTWITYIGYFILYIGLLGIMFFGETRFKSLSKTLEKIRAKKAS